MDIRTIRKFMLDDKNITNLVGNNIFLYEKPLDIKADTYICLLFKPLSGGAVKTYQLDCRLFSKDLVKINQLENALIERLDWIRQNYISDENCVIYHSSLLNGGGMTKDEKTGVYLKLLFFMLKTKNKLMKARK